MTEPSTTEADETVGTLAVKVWRGREQGAFQEFTVPRQASQTVLDVVTWIQRQLDPTLSYRFACRVGMCGSCAMMVNGTPRWTCRTHVSKVLHTADGDGALTLAPLDNLPVIKDLATDMTPFFDKWQQAGGRFMPPEQRPSDFVVVPPASRERRAADAGIECIGCGVCYAACDLVRWNADYLGPAALNRAWTLVNDVRDSGGDGRLAAVAGDAGCHACHSLESCREHCPKHINPTAAIAGLKRATALALLKGRL
jgi:fumarate reductase iron-sulfur subunit